MMRTRKTRSVVRVAAGQSINITMETTLETRMYVQRPRRLVARVYGGHDCLKMYVCVLYCSPCAPLMAPWLGELEGTSLSIA